MTRTELNDNIADVCGVELTTPCQCVQASGYHEEMLASPYCPLCDGTGEATQTNLVSALDKMSEDIDQLASDARDICEPAKAYLDLAWWHVEHAIRTVTGACSMRCKPGHYCACCAHYNDLKAKAKRLEGRL